MAHAMRVFHRILLLTAQVLICLLKIELFIRFNHELVEHNNIGVRQMLDRLHAQAHNCTAILDYLDVAFCSWHAIYTPRFSRAWNLQIAPPYKLVTLLRREDIT